MRISFALALCILTAAHGECQQKNDTLFYKTKEAVRKQNQVLLVLLHGYGSNEDDLMELASSFPDNFTLVSLRATFTLQPGSYQWYNSTSLHGHPDGNPADLLKSRTLVEQTIERLQKRLHINSARTFIAGFSQGANMSYLMGLFYPDLCGGPYLS